MGSLNLPTNAVAQCDVPARSTVLLTSRQNALLVYVDDELILLRPLHVWSRVSSFQILDVNVEPLEVQLWRRRT